MALGDADLFFGALGSLHEQAPAAPTDSTLVDMTACSLALDHDDLEGAARDLIQYGWGERPASTAHPHLACIEQSR